MRKTNLKGQGRIKISALYIARYVDEMISGLHGSACLGMDVVSGDIDTDNVHIAVRHSPPCAPEFDKRPLVSATVS